MTVVPGTSDIALRLTGLTLGNTYYARIHSDDPTFAVGGYKLELRPESSSGGGGGLDNPDSGTDDTAATSSSLSRLPSLAGTRQNFLMAASVPPRMWTSTASARTNPPAPVPAC